jgi:predicted  nucleic acid-binding Zn-ribbon protein
MSVSNRLNALSTERQRIPADGSGEAGASAPSARDVARLDASVAESRAGLAETVKKRDALRRDSLAFEARAAEGRARAAMEGKRIDSLLRVESAAMDEAAARILKARQSFSNSREKAQIEELKRRRLQVEEQLAAARAAFGAAAAARDRTKGATGAEERKITQQRAPLAALLAGAEAQLSEKLAEREALRHVDEMIVLDSAIKKTKDELNAAIERKAMRKKGADKLVDYYESELSSLMGKLDDAKRRYPQTAQYQSRWAAAISAAEKRRLLEKTSVALSAQIASLTSRRNQQMRNLDEFNRTHPSPVATWSRRVAQLDSVAAANEAAARRFVRLRDSLDARASILGSMAEGLSAVAAAETRKGDSAAAGAKRRWSELSALAARARADSVQKESVHRARIARLRTDLAAASARADALERECAESAAARERLAKSAADAGIRAERAKASSVQRRKALDDLIAATENEVARLSMRGDSVSRELQSIAREFDQRLRRHGLAISSINARLAACEKQIAAAKGGEASARMRRPAAGRALTDTLGRIMSDIEAVLFSIESKKSEIAALEKRRPAAEGELQGEVSKLDSIIAEETRALAAKQNALAAMQAKRNQTAQRLKAPVAQPTMQPAVQGANQSEAPAPVAAASVPPAPVAQAKAPSPPVSEDGGQNAIIAQKNIENIYSLLGSGKIDEASGHFNALRSFLMRYASPDAYQALAQAVEKAAGKKKGPKY